MFGTSKNQTCISRRALSDTDFLPHVLLSSGEMVAGGLMNAYRYFVTAAKVDDGSACHHDLLCIHGSYRNHTDQNKIGANVTGI